MKRTAIKLKKFFTLFWLLLLALTLDTCSSTQILKSPNELKADYERAIRDAEVAELNEIYKNLIAIIPANKNLVWKNDNEKNRILVVTWTSWDGYDETSGKEMELASEIWVTVVPEIKKFCEESRIRDAEKNQRLEQLLGLPPDNGKTKFIEMWVDPNNLFRPAPDPEISDQEAELDFPASDRFVTISEEYKKWFNDLMQNSYKENGYPWTRLGYTYDWGNPKSEIGLSEFVIRKGAMVQVHSVTPTSQYCKSR